LRSLFAGMDVCFDCVYAWFVWRLAVVAHMILHGMFVRYALMFVVCLRHI